MSRPISTLLIIEDFPPDRSQYRQSLLADSTCASYCLLEAESAIEGLELCRTRAIDAILLKDGLADASGLEFLAALQAQSQGENPSVVMIGGGEVSSQVLLQTAIQAVKMGAVSDAQCDREC
jgi:DNA-binding NarL/FixJ family response regulator